MSAMEIIGVVLLIAGALLAYFASAAPMLVAGVACILIGIVLTRIGKVNRRK